MKPASALQPWLNHAGSITEKAATLGWSPQLQVLSEQWRSRLYERRIMMFCQNVPAWYGRSLVPLATYQANEVLFKNLLSKPLGSVLFNNANIVLVSRFIKPVKASALPSALNINNTGCPLWSRVSTFNIQALPLYLEEIFLPEMMSLC